MIKYCSILVLLVFTLTGNAQGFGPGAGTQNPVQWEASVEKSEATSYTLKLNASIEPEWHVYSQFTDPGGSLPLELEFLEAGEAYTLEGPTEESETTTSYSDIFEVDETFFSETAQLTQKIKAEETTEYVKLILKYQVCKEVCINEEKYIVFDLSTEKGQVFQDFNEFQAYGKVQEKVEEIEPVKEVVKQEEKQDLWTIFFVAFASGFLALLTPCVFPMIPMTVSFFTKQSKNLATGRRNAILYGIFIVVIYVLLGSIVTGIFGADALNALSTNVWFNLVFFLLLVVFAISFFGAFEIMLPNSWANAVDRKADRGGIVGIFFMALALAIVSFSCTGPIVGTLLVQAASEGGIAPVLGMLGFSLAIAIPFALFALFPGLMNSLPKSGGWLNSVKVVLGFLELALAFKFLSNADLVLQAHILEREVFLAIWIAIFGAMAFYLFGKIRLSHDSPLPHISSGRLILGLFVLSFTLYLIPGLWGAPLKLISGFPPPLNYSESPYGVGYSKGSVAGLTEGELPEEAELGPYQLVTFTDYDAGMAYAKAENKPVLLDFTGKACVNCRKMEERVWGEPQILGKLQNDVVLISLFVDLKEELPEAEQYVSEVTGKRIQTVGNKWSDFQIEKYQINAQPYYVLLDHNDNELNTPVGYTPDVDEFEAWLEEGISKFND
ncbi:MULTISPECIES: protein-disulfide reductase DsbD family protein [Leeuwenhoekiella]|jgi:thiol:disulfide interchange protein DsbD|uniref:protein-disulfide reductase DsbD family protein n=3 Tax=Flavobacteriaceae TaxID=49546 RepID=UPI000EDB3539|nr:cytochrome c biogenesis protein CcdA [Leeuwenhoekiella blandensis]HCW64066.1 thiol:disulfide interchange protein [Leeuwenhoekiella sp.]|tara:strand:- start:19347 stop:21347 length:2001 start_codon:yes stop_codon:yes gene_type:complete